MPFPGQRRNDPHPLPAISTAIRPIECRASIGRISVTLVRLSRMIHEKGTMDFSEIYQRYAHDVHRFSLYLSGNYALAEDLTAETLVQMCGPTICASIP